MYANLKILYDYLMSIDAISGYDALFLKTAKEHADAIEMNLAIITTTHDKKVALEEIYRQAHSLKGSATLMKYDVIAEICGKIIEIVHPKEEIKEVEETSLLNSLLQQLQTRVKEIEERKDVQHSI